MGFKVWVLRASGLEFGLFCSRAICNWRHSKPNAYPAVAALAAFPRTTVYITTVTLTTLWLWPATAGF